MQFSTRNPSRNSKLVLLDTAQRDELPTPASEELYPLVSALVKARTVKGGLQNVIDYLVQNGPWSLGLVWLVKDGQLRFSCYSSRPETDAQAFIALSRLEPFRQGASLPRTVLETNKACIVNKLEQGAHMVRFQAAKLAGFSAALAWPLQDDGELMGVVEFYAAQSMKLADADLGRLNAQCRDIARFLEARRFDERLRTKHAQLAQAQRIARLAYWEYSPVTSSFRWTSELAEWLGVNVGRLPITLADYLTLVHADDQETLQLAFSQLGQPDTPRIEIEHRLVTMQGKLFHVLLQAEAELDDDASVLRISGTLQDLTEQKDTEARVQASERRWQAAFRNSPLPSLIFDAETWQCQSWNDESLEFLGVPADQVQGRNPVELGLWSRVVNKRIGASLHTGDGAVRHLECRMRRKDGDRFLLVNMEHLELDGRDSILAQLVDITSRKRLEQTLRLTVAAVEHSSDALVILSQKGRIVSTNPAFSRITGYDQNKALGKVFDKLIRPACPQNKPFFQTALQEMSEQGAWEGEVTLIKRSSETVPILLSLSAIRDEAGHVTHYVSVFGDVSKQKEYEERLRQMALNDGLTGLPNRRLFIERGNQALLAAERHDQGVSVLFIDLDKFKPVNDEHGHAVGDALLVQVARRLSMAVRSADTVARLGGDEFVILFPELSDTQGLTVVAQKIIRLLDEPFDIEGAQLKISASVGIARYPVDGADIDALLRAADDSLYTVKEEGRNGFAFYSEDPL